MSEFKIFPRRSFRDSKSDRVTDLGLFFNYLYKFWYYKGHWNAVLHRLTDFLNCLVLSILVFVFSLMFDWDAALTCSGEECASVKLIHSPHLPKKHFILAWIFNLSCFIVTLWELRNLLEAYWLYGEVRYYVMPAVKVGERTPFHYYLRQVHRAILSRSWEPMTGMDDQQELMGINNTSITGTIGQEKRFLEDMTWAEFLSLILQRCLKEDRGVKGHKELDELKVVRIMMQYSNYQLALHHHGILNQAPLCYADEATYKLIISSIMQNHRVQDKASAMKAVKDKIFLCTLGLFLLYPFVISFMFMKFVVKVVAEMKHSPEALVSRSWSLTAKWRFRLYNEVDHFHQARLWEGNEKAIKIMNRSNAALENPVARVLQRAASCFILIIVVGSWINTPLLNYGMLFGRTMIWWLSTAMLVYGVATAFNKQTTREYDHTEDLEGLIVNLHYAKEDWYRSAASFVKDVELELLPLKIYSSLMDFLFVIFAPVVFFAIFKSEALERMVSFVCEHSSEDGSFCIGSTFNLRDNILRKTRGPNDEGVEGDSDDDHDDDETPGRRSRSPTPPPHSEDGSASAMEESKAHISPAGDALMGAAHGGGRKKRRVSSKHNRKNHDDDDDDTDKKNSGGVRHRTLKKNPFGTSYGLKIEKSIASFISIYPAWYERYQQNCDVDAGGSGDILGIEEFLEAISDKHDRAMARREERLRQEDPLTSRSVVDEGEDIRKEEIEEEDMTKSRLPVPSSVVSDPPRVPRLAISRIANSSSVPLPQAPPQPSQQQYQYSSCVLGTQNYSQHQGGAMMSPRLTNPQHHHVINVGGPQASVVPVTPRVTDPHMRQADSVAVLDELHCMNLDHSLHRRQRQIRAQHMSMRHGSTLDTGRSGGQSSTTTTAGEGAKGHGDDDSGNQFGNQPHPSTTSMSGYGGL